MVSFSGKPDARTGKDDKDNKDAKDSSLRSLPSLPSFRGVRVRYAAAMNPASRLAVWAAALILLAYPASAGRLDSIVAEHLQNGLTVLVLEDATQPIVSTQVLYRVGGRTEHTGSTGLAHFVEHMAFRATEKFPETDVVSRIYAVGGEWHGYTWLDETTYFETVPKEHLQLVLDIQADRMAHLLLPPAELEAERGAVLTELHGYENDPASVLHDAVAAASFTEHPYRQNVIGWTSDVEHITYADVATFYRRHYNPANAVLAIAGDVKAAEALTLVRQTFGRIPAGEITPPPYTVEPPQTGERRIELAGGSESRFEIAYRAPAASEPDFPTFLLIQALLSGSSGANFRQDGDGFAARPGSRLYGVSDEVATFFAPTAQPYLFTIQGTGAPAAIEERLGAIEERVAVLREQPVSADELDRVRRALLLELAMDIETTEDAAHQMAFYGGIGALDVLKRLPALVATVRPEDVRRVAQARLQPWQRTIGWIHPGAPPALPTEAPPPVPIQLASTPPPQATRTEPRVKQLANGTALIVQRISRIGAGYLRVIIPGESESPVATVDEPVWRHTSLGVAFRAGGLADAVAEIRRALETATPVPAQPTGDPAERLDRSLRQALGITPEQAGQRTPIVIAAVGDLDEAAALRMLEASFSDLPPLRPLTPVELRAKVRDVNVPLPGKAQSQIGYAVPAPPSSPAWRMLLYILTHDYEGRLGKELIARRGLLYRIESRYRSDGKTGWLSMRAGVNLEKLDETRQLFFGMLDALREQPLTEAEVEEARQHLIGRRLTAPMSNEEVSDAYAREWIERGRLLTNQEWEREVRKVTREDVLEIVPMFLSGVKGAVDVRAAPARP